MMLSFLSYAFSILFVCLLQSSCLLVVVTASSFSSSSARISASKTRLGEDSSLPLYGMKPDKFVASAPLVVAAVCQDGVVLVATHTACLKEPLLMDSDEGNEDIDIASAARDSDMTRLQLPLIDIPLNFRGPFRIHSVDGFGTTLTCAGWRTDGEMLAAAFRSLASTEQDRFGAPFNAQQYGRYLAEEASTWMAKCAVSDTQRALSCVGLLATSARDDNDDCCLWLVDATGAYRVRAHAVGLGASIINKRLRRIDFSALNSQEGALRLLRTITEEPNEKEQSQEKEKERATWKLADNARVEVAVVAPLQQKMNRIRLVSLIS